MCICIDCEYVDRCITYHAVEAQHQQAHLTQHPDFMATNPTINVNIRTSASLIDSAIDSAIEMEWDVVGCESFSADRGRWARLRPNQQLPT